MTRHDEEGSAVLEVVLLAPVLILILAAVVGGARVTLAHQRVDAAAAQAARAASAATSASAATALARSTAWSAASSGGLDCTSMAVTVDVADFHPGGSVTVRVSCAADLGAGVPGLSGRRTISGSRSEVIDTYTQVTG
jgi:Flp pilus assembly protein TadG